MTRTLHLTEGNSAAAALRLALAPEEADVLEAPDCLSVGPLVRAEDPADWTSVRERFWKDILEPYPTGDDGWDLAPPAAAKLRDRDELTLWLGTSVTDQLRLPWVVDLFRLRGIELPQLSVAQLESSERRPDREILGLGMLSPEMIRDLRPPPRSIAAEDLRYLERAWSALTAAEPEALVELVAAGEAPLPYLLRALRVTLDRFPAARRRARRLRLDLCGLDGEPDGGGQRVPRRPMELRRRQRRRRMGGRRAPRL